jgi:NAD(P)-dependent dehydrogenase (short-subunit alcohol dehydrogenase family)
LEDDITEMFKINVVGNIHLFNTFLPLIKNGKTKKVVTISSGMSDGDVAAKYELHEGAPYSVSKAAMNMVNAKYQAEFKKDGIIFMAVCPGTVNTRQNDNSEYLGN